MNKINSYKVGEKIVDTLLLSEATVRKTKNGKDYLQATLSDGNTTIDTKMWDWKNNAILEVGSIYNIAGTISTFRDQKQLILDTLDLCRDQDKTSFMPSVGMDLEVLNVQLHEAIESIDNTGLFFITMRTFEIYEDAILHSTAAKVIHHVGIGGLALHTLEVYNIAVAICKECAQANLDLVKAGALMHDIGKIFTYTYQDPLLDLTVSGKLLDHMALGTQIIDKIVAQIIADENYSNAQAKYWRQTALLLKHIVLAHHGKPEFGSSVTPKFLEAQIVHWADLISATTAILKKANDTTMGKTFTDKVYALGNTEYMRQDAVDQILANTQEM